LRGRSGDLPQNAGMVFPLVPRRVERMWMKNTSDAPVRAVVELRGGEAENCRLGVGDLVSWKQPDAAH
jgi:uncharacterized membrane protein (UPF0127 family)